VPGPDYLLCRLFHGRGPPPPGGGAINRHIFYHSVLTFERVVYVGLNMTTTKKGRQLFGRRKVHPDRENPGYGYEKRARLTFERILQLRVLAPTAEIQLSNATSRCNLAACLFYSGIPTSLQSVSKCWSTLKRLHNFEWHSTPASWIYLVGQHFIKDDHAQDAQIHSNNMPALNSLTDTVFRTYYDWVLAKLSPTYYVDNFITCLWEELTCKYLANVKYKLMVPILYTSFTYSVVKVRPIFS